MLATIHSSNRSSQIPYVILATKYTYCIVYMYLYTQQTETGTGITFSSDIYSTNKYAQQLHIPVSNLHLLFSQQTIIHFIDTATNLKSDKRHKRQR